MKSAPIRLSLCSSHLPGLDNVEVVELRRTLHEPTHAAKELLRFWPIGRFHGDFLGLELDDAEVIAGSLCVGRNRASQRLCHAWRVRRLLTEFPTEGLELLDPRSLVLEDLHKSQRSPLSFETAALAPSTLAPADLQGSYQLWKTS